DFRSLTVLPHRLDDIVVAHAVGQFGMDIRRRGRVDQRSVLLGHPDLGLEPFRADGIVLEPVEFLAFLGDASGGLIVDVVEERVGNGLPIERQLAIPDLDCDVARRPRHVRLLRRRAAARLRGTIGGQREPETWMLVAVMPCHGPDSSIRFSMKSRKPARPWRLTEARLDAWPGQENTPQA